MTGRSLILISRLFWRRFRGEFLVNWDWLIGYDDDDDGGISFLGTFGIFMAGHVYKHFVFFFCYLCLSNTYLFVLQFVGISPFARPTCHSDDY